MCVVAIATLGIVLTAAYVMRVYQRTMTGPLNPDLPQFVDLKAREITALVPIAVLTIALGIMPAPILNVINPAVERTLEISELKFEGAAPVATTSSEGVTP
jgi:NADH-quinone oxidoreductase subunit M